MKIMINGRPLQERTEELTQRESQYMEQIKLFSYAALFTVIAYMLQLFHKLLEHHNEVVQVAFKVLEGLSI